MDEILEIIHEITKYGLNAKLEMENNATDLEKNLIKLYSKFFEIEYEFDDRDFPNFNKAEFPNIVENVKSNFPDFSYYQVTLNPLALYKKPELGIGDAIDDLTDIILDLLEIKWRKENNSEQDALCFFELIFKSHTQQHVINLLNFMKKSQDV